MSCGEKGIFKDAKVYTYSVKVFSRRNFFFVCFLTCGGEVVLHMMLGICWVRIKRVDLSSLNSNSPICPAVYDYMSEYNSFLNSTW